MTNTVAVPSNGAPFRSPQAALRRTRLRYGAGVALRLAWYAGLARLVGRLTPPPARPVPSVGRLPGPAQLRADVLALMKADLANIEAGYYPVPADLLPRPRRTLRAARDLLRDLPAVAQRRRAADIGAVPEIEGMPDYFRRTFHYQTDGYLSDRSAMLYDTQVEVLFLGTAAMMRRQALAPIARYLAARPEIALPRLLDIACGTGLFLGELGKAFPAIRRSGLDLSAPYLKAAAAQLGDQVPLFQGNAEALPFANESQDIVSSVYLFHELPDAARRNVAAEMTRVLAPGGLAVLADSLQFGDHPSYDALLARFPIDFHEPYYDDYLRTDLAALFADAGLRLRETIRAHVTKIMIFERL